MGKEWKEEQDIAKTCLHKAAKRIKKSTDTKRHPKEYNEGEMVLIKLLPNPFKSLRKVHKGLIRKYEGPFLIVEKVGKAA